MNDGEVLAMERELVPAQTPQRVHQPLVLVCGFGELMTFGGFGGGEFTFGGSSGGGEFTVRRLERRRGPRPKAPPRRAAQRTCSGTADALVVGSGADADGATCAAVAGAGASF